jgi:chromate transporter
MSPAESPAPSRAPARAGHREPPGLLALWWVNFLVGATGFGGSIMWLRREMVERRQWLTAEEFNAGLSIAQFMPGPNVFNLMAAVARHLRGTPGVVVSSVAIMTAPFFFVIVLGTLYARYGDLPAAKAAMRGIAPVAAGIMLSFGLKTASSPALRSPIVIVAILTFGVVVWFRLSLPVIMLTMAPLGILIAARRVR